MPAHDWTRVKAGILHHFHQQWIGDLARTLNDGLLPRAYYALEEQRAAGVEPDVLTLEATNTANGLWNAVSDAAAEGATLLLDLPQTKIIAETDLEFYRRKQSSLVVRHATDDRVVAMIEVDSPGNKSGRVAMRMFTEKATDLLARRVHLLVLDVLPPGTCDPDGIHGLIWGEVSGEEYTAPADKPLTLASYESSDNLRGFVEPFAVSDPLCDMPLYLEPGGHIRIPTEATYQRAYAAVPERWRRVLTGGS